MAREVGSHILSKVYSNDKDYHLGEIVYDELGNEHRFIKFNAGDGAATGTVGHLVVGLDTGGSYKFWEGTNDLNSATIKAILQRAFGFLRAALTDGSFGFVQKNGPNKEVMVTDGSVAQGEQLMAHASTTGGVDSHDDTAATVVGTALEADGTTSANQLDAGQVDIRIP